ncbi:inverse autotransporter beta domain-containing protein, partial [Morganella morganii subsp. sibonii]
MVRSIGNGIPRLPDKKRFLRSSGDTATTAPIPSIVSDITGSNSRVGVGGELWANYLKFAANG